MKSPPFIGHRTTLARLHSGGPLTWLIFFIYMLSSIYMAGLPMTFSKTRSKITVELDRNRLERLAGDLGFFSTEFLASLDRAEEDIRAGRTRTVNSLRTLRKRAV